MCAGQISMALDKLEDTQTAPEQGEFYLLPDAHGLPQYSGLQKNSNPIPGANNGPVYELHMNGVR